MPVTRAARLGGILLIVAFGIAYLVWRPFVPGGTPLTDFAAYYAGGAVWLHGGDPYTLGIWNAERQLPDSVPEVMNPYVGPPLGLPLRGALALFPYGVAAALWATFLVACCAIILRIPAYLAGRRLSRGDAVSLAIFWCACAPLILGLALGQAALPATAAVALAVVLVERSRVSWAALAAACAAFFKPNIALVLIAALRSRRTAIGFCAAAGLLLMLNVIVAGGTPHLIAYVKTLALQTTSERFYSYQFTPTAIAHGFGLANDEAMLAGSLVAIVAIGIAIFTIWESGAGVGDGALIACAAWPFVSPYVHGVDLAIALLPAFVAFHRARGGAWTTAACSLMLLALNPFALARGPSGVAFSIVGAAVAALALTALAVHVRTSLRLAPLAIVAAVLLVGAVAPAHVFPTWPADLPRSFVAHRHAAPNVVWHREIVATGLEEISPWVALLRTFALGGCALAGVAIVATVRAERAVAPERVAARRPAAVVPAISESSGS